jgi:hypothetical protein
MIQDVPGARSPTVSRTIKGAAGIGFSRSQGVPASTCVREKPEGIAFAVHLWARGNRINHHDAAGIPSAERATIIMGEPISQDDHNGTLRCRTPP